jgi:hypothetical protein
MPDNLYKSFNTKLIIHLNIVDISRRSRNWIIYILLYIILKENSIFNLFIVNFNFLFY